MELKQAQKLAQELIEIIKPFADIALVAGSVRREKAMPKDIEIVAQVQAANRTRLGIALLNAGVKFEAIRSTSRYVKASYKSEKVDLFLPTATDFWRQFAIRTGDADYSAGIAARWVKLGWVGTEDGLRLRSECEKKGQTWTCKTTLPTMPPIWENEKAFFDWLGLPFIEPKYRENGSTFQMYVDQPGNECHYLHFAVKDCKIAFNHYVRLLHEKTEKITGSGPEEVEILTNYILANPSKWTKKRDNG